MRITASLQFHRKLGFMTISDLGTESVPNDSTADDLEWLFADYQTCHMQAGCDGRATYLAICYHCDTGETVCQHDIESLPSRFGLTTLFTHGHICLTELVQFIPLDMN